jgi:glycosyltransferase involved in cell wall biosynthesis
MLFAKGIDLAVEAVRRARSGGWMIELDLYGAPDPANPGAISRERLEQWSALDGIRWHGATSDVAGIWAKSHVCCLPSRGGEGLPRTLLEGAACGRAVVTTAVPGCSDFIRDGVEGLVVPPDDAAALAEAFTRLAAEPALVARLGEAARSRVLDGYTVDAVSARLADVYRDLTRPRTETDNE